MGVGGGGGSSEALKLLDAEEEVCDDVLEFGIQRIIIPDVTDLRVI